MYLKVYLVAFSRKKWSHLMDLHVYLTHFRTCIRAHLQIWTPGLASAYQIYLLLSAFLKLKEASHRLQRRNIYLLQCNLLQRVKYSLQRQTVCSSSWTRGHVGCTLSSRNGRMEYVTSLTLEASGSTHRAYPGLCLHPHRSEKAEPQSLCWLTAELLLLVF